jgi:hypothetical protein
MSPAAETTTKKLTLTRDDVLKPTIWEPTGRSPGNTPQAKLQASQLFLQMLANPALAPLINARALLKVMVNEGPLQNARDVIYSDAELQQNAANQQQPSGPPQGPNVPPQPGGQVIPPVAPNEAGPMPQGLPDVGPGAIPLPVSPIPGPEQTLGNPPVLG